MKVICIREHFGCSIGIEYLLRPSIHNDFYFIYDEKIKTNISIILKKYSNRYFMPIEEYRNKKIDNILDKQNKKNKFEFLTIINQLLRSLKHEKE